MGYTAILIYIFRFFIAFLHGFMKFFLAFLRLVRWPNLLIVFITQALIWFCIIRNVDSRESLFLSFPNFLCLSLSTVLIAAAGYILNDYFDIEIDRINKPEKVIVGNIISKQSALGFYFLLNIAAIALSLYLSILLHSPQLAGIQLVCLLLLWAYAAVLKRSFLLGNLVVALLTALTVLILVAYEPSLYHLAFAKWMLVHNSELTLNPIKLIFGYTYFAFMLTWMREIVKDVQDMDGDKACGCRTLPILKGVKVANRWLEAIFLTVVVPLVGVAFAMFDGKWMVLSLYIFIGLILPLCLFIVALLREVSIAGYGKLSSLLKLVMLLGILPLVIYYFLTFRG